MKEKLPGGGESVSSYMYSKSFPVPDGAKGEEHDISIDKNTIELKFKKTKKKQVKKIKGLINV